MRTSILSFFLLFLCAYSFGQQKSKSEKIHQLLEVTGSGKLGVQVARNLLSQYEKTFTSVDKQFWIKFSKELNPEELISLIIPIYDKYFSEEEIDQLLAFYNTPLGIKLIKATPKIMEESMQIGSTWGKKLRETIMKRLMDNGYIKN